jgi:hypothetical protein
VNLAVYNIGGQLPKPELPKSLFFFFYEMPIVFKT